MKLFVAVLAFCAVTYGYVPGFDGRIVGGQEADISDYPYQVSVREYDRHVCGGSILDNNTILTAAHCVYFMDHSQFSVRVGNSHQAQGTPYKVNQVRQNSDYNPVTVDNDMAILKLSSPLAFSSTVQPIELQPQGVEVAAGTTAWVSGWGKTSEFSLIDTAIVRAVNVDVISNAECSSRYGAGRITSHMMCAQTLGHDACQGDSGGPLVADGKLIGVVSWGFGCARPQYPGVYAKVSDMYSWIVSNSY